jgi:anti-sigma factor RsiW
MMSPHRTPDWLLERIALGELPPEELAAARARLAQEPDGEARLAALEAENRALLEQLPPSAVAREVERRARRDEARSLEASPWHRWRPALALVPVLAVLLLVVARPGTRPGALEGERAEETRTKGLPPQLGLHRLAAQGPEALAQGALAARGDVVQVSYVAAGARFGVIFSVDGRGTVTLHAPESGLDALPLEPSGTHALPQAYALDDAPAFERFFFVTSDDPFSLEEVLAPARVLATSDGARTALLPLAERFRQVSFTLEKSSP